MAASSTSYTLLYRLTQRQSAERPIVDLMLIGFPVQQREELLSLIRSSGLSPRAQVIDSETSLLAALVERSWDLILCTTEFGSSLHPESVCTHLRNQGSAAPVIQLESDPDFDQVTQAVQSGVTHLLPMDREPLLMLRILSEYQIHADRQRLSRLEPSIKELQAQLKTLQERSELALIALEQGKTIQANPAFMALFGLSSEEPLPTLKEILSEDAVEQLDQLLNPNDPLNSTDLEFIRTDQSHFVARATSLFLELPDQTLHQLSIDPFEVSLDSSEPVLGAEDTNTEPSSEPEQVETIDLEAAALTLGEAIDQNRMTLMYQPLVHLDEGFSDQHFEVLLRMRDYEDREIFPAEFLCSLDQSEVMVKLDRWVASNALRALQAVQTQEANRTLFLNLSRRTLNCLPFVSWLVQLIADLELPPSSVTLELSENDVAIDPEQAETFVDGLRRSGCRICLKHFGGSTQSEQVFQRLKPEYVKIDGAYINELTAGSNKTSALSTLLAPTRGTDTHVIAPLIEEIGQLGELVRLGIDLVQGYYLQPPQKTMEYEFFEG